MSWEVLMGFSMEKTTVLSWKMMGKTSFSKNGGLTVINLPDFMTCVWKNIRLSGEYPLDNFLT